MHEAKNYYSCGNLQRIRKNEKVGQSHNGNQHLLRTAEYSLQEASGYKSSRKRCKKRGYNEAMLDKVIKILINNGQLPPKYLTHKLQGKFKGCLECHISDDWVLIWKQDDKRREIRLVNTGTHSELFGKTKR